MPRLIHVAVGPIAPGEVVTATATDPGGNTSEFSGRLAGITFEFPASGQFVIGDLAPHSAGNVREGAVDPTVDLVALDAPRRQVL